MKIGILSDTHSYFDPRLPEFFDGVEHIIHAGDIGDGAVLDQLKKIAPVTAVLGNSDDDLELKETEIAQLDGRTFLIQHIVNPRGLGEPLKARIARTEPDVVVFGHTHRPFCQIIGGILYFNPGHASKQHFGLERSVATFNWGARGIRPQFLKL
jgi:putative phosphoesterase